MNTTSDPTDPNSAGGISEQSASDSRSQNVALPESHETLQHERLDLHQTATETAALAAHLQRVGVIWLPPPDSDSMNQIATRFADCDPPQQSTGNPDEPQLKGTSPTVDAPNHSNVNTATPDASGGRSHTAQPQPNRPTANRPTATRPASRLQGVSAVHTTEDDYPGDSLPSEQRDLQLKQLEHEVQSCTLCPALASCRNNTVFGEGNPNPRFAFFGEGPGEEEDLTGQPFVGRSGDLLTKMIIACGLQREDTYILNTVKCRPPGNRNPEGDELTNCRSYYQQQFNVLRPEYIVCLGAVSAQELLGTKLSVGRLRGTLHRYFASKVLVTYHPSYLLRNPAAKKAAWADLQFLMRDAGIPIPKR